MKKSQSPTVTTFWSHSFFQSVIIWLFHFLVLSVPLFFTFNTSELFEFNKMILTYILTILIVSAWVGRMIVSSSFIFRRTYLDIPLLIFLISQLLAMVFSIHPYTSLLGYYSRFHGGLVSVITYILLYFAFVSNVEKKHLPSFLLSVTGSAVVVSLYGILEHFGHSISCFLVSEGKEFGVDCWKQDVKNRVFASFGQPNWLAAYVITLLPLSFVLALRNYKNSALSIYYSIATILFFVVLLFTQSRSGFLGAAVGGAVLLGLISFKLWNNKSVGSFIKSNTLQMLSMVFGVLLAALSFGTPYSPSLGKLFQPELTQPVVETQDAPVVNRLDVGGTDSGEIRKIVWQGAIRVWQRYPIFGSGLETFGYSYYQDRPVQHNLVSEWDFLYNKAHNEFLNFLATTGLVGLISYLILLGYFGWYCFKNLLKTPEKKQSVAWLLAAMVAGVVALSVSNFFGFSTVMVAILMHLYFGIAALVTQENDQHITTKPITSTTYMLLSSTALFMIFFLRMVFQYWTADIAYTKGKTYMEAGYFEYGMPKLIEAIEKNPQEATFYDELATQYALYAVPYSEQGQTEQAAILLQAAQEASDATIKLNDRQLNFYKTRTRVFITLAQLKIELLGTAKQTLLDAIELAPTDAKLYYNLGIVEISMTETELGIQSLEKAIELKPNYEQARLQLGLAYESVGNNTAALEQFEYIVEYLSPTNEQALDRIASLSAELK